MSRGVNPITTDQTAGKSWNIPNTESSSIKKMLKTETQPPFFKPPVNFRKEDIEATIPERFEQQVENYPDHPAIRTRDKEITYTHLNRMANRIARVICDSTQNDADPVGLLFEPGIGLIASILGVLKTGRIWVLLDPSHPPDRISHIINDSQACLMITDHKNLSMAKTLQQKQHLLLNIDETEADIGDENLQRPIKPDAFAHIIYTSGSTGQPKGVVHNHRLVLHNIWLHTNSFGIYPDDRISLFSTLSQQAGITDLFRALLNGAALLPFNLRKEGFLHLPSWLRKERITIFHSVPTVFRQLINSLNGKGEFPDLRIIHLGGEPVLKQDVEFYKAHFPEGCTLVVILGASEAPTFRQNFIHKETRLTNGVVPAGYRVEDKEVFILDDQGRRVQRDQPGEIAVRSRFLASEYWRKPELTQRAFIDDPVRGDQRLYRTGDLGKILPDGALIYLGRKDKQVKIGGQRIEIDEIENVLLEHTAINVCTVVDKENTFGDKYLTAYIVSRTIPAPTELQLRNHIKQKLPVYMTPSRFVFLDEFPLLPNGKINRRALQESDDAYRSNSGVELVLPRDEIEDRLKNIWEEILAVQPLGIRDNFFELGGTSLQAAHLLTIIAKQFGKELDPPALIQAPTIEQLASILRLQNWTASVSSLVAMRPGGSKPPFFCIPGNMSVPFIHLKHLAKHLGPDQPFYGFQDGVQNPSRIEDLAAVYLSELATVQPKGPYFLGGLCMGGLIAFEMAQQLLAQGHEVALLALMEAAPPRGPGISSLVNVAALYLHRATKRLSHHSRIAFTLSNEEQKAYIRLKMKLNANSWALRQYEPRPYPGRIDLFLTPESLGPPSHPRSSWRNLAVGGAEIHQIPGTYNTITGHDNTDIEEDSVRVLAHKLRECIDTITALRDRESCDSK